MIMTYDIKNKRVLVTGATGLIGSRLTLALLSQGCAVRVMVRNPEKARPLAEKGAEVVYGDMTEPRTLEAAVKDCQVVFHLAGILGSQSKPLSYFRKVNVEGSRILAEAALKENVERFIFAGTAWVYGFHAGDEVNEKAPRCLSNDPYCDTKLEAENMIRQLIRDRGLPGVIFQPAEVYGPEDHAWTLDPINLIKSSLMMLPLKDQGVIQPIYIDDVIEGIMAVTAKGAIGEIYILCGTQITPVREFFTHYARMVGKKSIPSAPGFLMSFFAVVSQMITGIIGKQPLFTQCAVRGVMKTTTYSHQKAASDLQFIPKTTLEQGMQQVQAWLRTIEQ
jgi:nucleoside-diphosphate-sugar epimerase